MRSPIIAILAAAVLAACGTDPTPAPASAPLESPTPSPSPTRTEPAVRGVGATQLNSDAQSETEVTVLRIRQPLRAAIDLPAGSYNRRGREWAAVEVKLCVKRNSLPEEISVSWYPWSLSYKDGTVTDSASSYSQDWWEEQLYPIDRVVRVGRCVRGWVPFEVRRGSRPELVTYAPSGGPVLEWQVK